MYILTVSIYYTQQAHQLEGYVTECLVLFFWGKNALLILML